MAILPSDLGSCCSDPSCPAQVSFAGCVLPSGPSPCDWLSRPPSTMPHKTPRRDAAVPGLPDRSLLGPSTRAHAVSGLFTLACSSSVSFMASPRSGAGGASRVLQRLSSCMPRPEDSDGPPHPSHTGCFVLSSSTLKLSTSATSLFRSCTSTSGSALSPTAYRILCVRLPPLSFADCSAPH